MTTEELAVASNNYLREHLKVKVEEMNQWMYANCQGGLNYGWDWATAYAIGPEELVAEIIALKREGLKKGLK